MFIFIGSFSLKKDQVNFLLFLCLHTRLLLQNVCLSLSPYYFFLQPCINTKIKSLEKGGLVEKGLVIIAVKAKNKFLQVASKN